jgi:hypothetical protein
MDSINDSENAENSICFTEDDISNERDESCVQKAMHDASRFSTLLEL